MLISSYYTIYEYNPPPWRLSHSHYNFCRFRSISFAAYIISGIFFSFRPVSLFVGALADSFVRHLKEETINLRKLH